MGEGRSACGHRAGEWGWGHLFFFRKKNVLSQAIVRSYLAQVSEVLEGQGPSLRPLQALRITSPINKWQMMLVQMKLMRRRTSSAV